MTPLSFSGQVGPEGSNFYFGCAKLRFCVGGTFEWLVRSCTQKNR